MVVENPSNNPDGKFNPNLFSIRNKQNPIAQSANEILRQMGRQERWRIIFFEDRILGEGIWTRRQYIDIIYGIRIGIDQNYHLQSNEFEIDESNNRHIYSFRVDPRIVDFMIKGDLLRKKKGKKERYDLTVNDYDNLIREVIIDRTPSRDGRIKFSIAAIPIEVLC